MLLPRRSSPDPPSGPEDGGDTYLPWCAPDFTRPEASTSSQALSARRSMGELWSLVKPCAKLQDPVHERGGGGGDVQRADPAALRQRDELVAGAGHTRAQPPPLGS